MLYKEVICFFILLSVILLLNHLFGHVKKVSKTLIASQPDENYQQVRKLLKDVHIKNIKYDEFDVLEYFADGGTCQVKKAMWSNGSNKKYVVLKYVRAESIQELDRELKVHRAINIKNSHENIIKFHGLSKSPKGSDVIVLEYAELGDLREYLKNEFANITWEEKINISIQISNGLSFLHANDILHRDLHTRNIVLSARSGKVRAMITDFGMSKVLSRKSLTVSEIHGLLAFVDPIVLNEKSYRNFTEKSDVYSLGVILWEISSGIPPFKGWNNCNILASVLYGEREKPTQDTPCEYIEIYQKCWDKNPDQRPNVDYVSRKLKEKTIITGSVFKGWEKCCENYPHYSSIPRLFKKRTLSEPDSISLNLIANERTTELLVNLQEIDKWCIEQPKNEVMKFIKQSAPNLAKLIEHKNFSINENSFAH